MSRTAAGKLDLYNRLIHEWPLRPIRTPKDYQAAVAIADRLAVRGEDDLDPAEADYLDVLSRLISDYDDQHHHIDTAHQTPAHMLRHLMEQRGMTAADLGRLLGSSGLASDVLNGNRQLSKANIAKVASHFRIDASLFLPALKRAHVKSNNVPRTPRFSFRTGERTRRS